MFCGRDETMVPGSAISVGKKDKSIIIKYLPFPLAVGRQWEGGKFPHSRSFPRDSGKPSLLIARGVAHLSLKYPPVGVTAAPSRPQPTSCRTTAWGRAQGGPHSAPPSSASDSADFAAPASHRPACRATRKPPGIVHSEFRSL